MVNLLWCKKSWYNQGVAAPWYNYTPYRVTDRAFSLLDSSLHIQEGKVESGDIFPPGYFSLPVFFSIQMTLASIHFSINVFQTIIIFSLQFVFIFPYPFFLTSPLPLSTSPASPR